MHTKRYFIVFSLLTALSLTVNGQTASGAITSPVTGPMVPVAPTAKIEPGLLYQLESRIPVDFIVRFASQADLTPAYTMDWDSRGEYVLQALTGAARNQEAAKAYLNRRGLAYQTFLAGNELYVFKGLETDALALAGLAEISGIRQARTYSLSPISAALRTTDLPIQPPDGLTWPVTFTNADQFWGQFGVQGEGVVVANIDTGVQWDHEALDQAYKCSSDPDDPSCWYDPGVIDCTGTSGGPCDTGQHGTATMGPMVADNDPALTYEVGMAPGAQWIACMGCANFSCSDYELNACADWILAPGGDPGNRPDIVNNSWGGPGNNDWFQDKIMAWEAAGIFPTFPSGGSGPTCNSIGSPGDYPEVFTSAAIDQSGIIASFSSRGPSLFGVTKPNIASPGVDLWLPVPDSSWYNFNGTSFSSAYSAGAVALLWSCNPGMKGDVFGTFQVLQENATYIEDQSCGGQPGQYNNVYGWGDLNVLAAGLASCSPHDFSVQPDSLHAVLEFGLSLTQTLTLENTSSEVMDWEIYEEPYVDWLSASPIFGTIYPDELQTITVTFDSSSVSQPGEYTTSFTFSTYPPQGPVSIPVTMTVIPMAVYGVELTPEALIGSSPPGSTLTYTLSVSNTGNIEDTYAVNITGVDDGWEVIQPALITVPAYTSSNLEVMVTVPPGFNTPPDEITVTVTSTSDPAVTDSSTITTTPFIYRLFLPLIMKS